MHGSDMHAIRASCQATMRVAALETGKTVYLAVRSGIEAVCVHGWREASPPIRTLMVEVGCCRRFGVERGGLRTPAVTSKDEREERVQHVDASLPVSRRLTSSAFAETCDIVRARRAALICHQVRLGAKPVAAASRHIIVLAIGTFSVAARAKYMSRTRLSKVSTLVLHIVSEIKQQYKRS